MTVNITIALGLFVIGFVLGVAIAAFGTWWLLKRTRDSEQQVRDMVGNLSRAALQQNTDQFVTLAQQVLEPIKETLQQQEGFVREIERKREHAYGDVTARLAQMTETQTALHQETNKLVQALRSPTVRGKWGELQLQRLLEASGMQQHCDFVQQAQSTGSGKTIRPDVIVRLPNERCIVIDAKVPLDAFIQALHTDDAEQHRTYLKKHAQAVREHVNTMSKRDYQSQIDGSHDFTVLFIAGEVFYSAALEYDPLLLDDAFAKGIILASPANLMGLLKAIALGWNEKQLAEQSREIKQLGDELYKRLKIVAQYMADVGSALNKSVEAYNHAVSSMERNLLTSAKRMHECGIGQEPITPPSTVDPTTQPFTKRDLLPPTE
jgi:DNA recombination protein RmuC